MEKDQNWPWERIKIAIEASGASSINAFATLIGLKQAETLYRIEKGKNGISKELAKRIHAVLPQFEVAWLTCGGSDLSDLSEIDHDRMVSIPIYEDLGTRRSQQSVNVPYEMVNGANMALIFKNSIIDDKHSQGSVLLLKKTKNKIEYGEMHLVCTDTLNAMCIIKRSIKKEEVILTPIQENLFSDITLDKSFIRELYLVCGCFPL